MRISVVSLSMCVRGVGMGFKVVVDAEGVINGEIERKR